MSVQKGYDLGTWRENMRQPNSAHTICRAGHWVVGVMSMCAHTPGQWRGPPPWGERGWVRTAAPSSPLWQGLPVFWHTAPMAVLRNLKRTNTHTEEEPINTCKRTHHTDKNTPTAKALLQATPPNYSCCRDRDQKAKCVFVFLACWHPVYLQRVPHPAFTPNTHTPPLTCNIQPEVP